MKTLTIKQLEDWEICRDLPSQVGVLSGVVQHDDQGGEVGDISGRFVLGVGGDVASLDVLD